MEEFPKMKGIRARITLKENIAPISQPARRIPLHLEMEVKEDLQDFLDQGIIEKCYLSSGWCNPTVIVGNEKRKGLIKSKERKRRICVDLRKLNEYVVKQPHPFPSVEMLSSKLCHAKIFSKLDLSHAYHQVRTI